MSAFSEKNFRINVCGKGDYLDITCSGRWTFETAQSYFRELRINTLFVTNSRYLGAILRLSNHGPQDRRVIDVHASAMRLATTRYGVRVAVLSGDLSRETQMGAAALASGHRCFVEPKEAMDWLLG